MTWSSKISLIIVSFCWISAMQSQKNLLQSGPMVGQVTLRDVSLWVQTKGEANVAFTWNEKGNKTAKTKSQTVKTLSENGYTKTIHLTNLKPGTSYEYQLYINNQPVTLNYPTEFKTQEHWQFRRNPPDFTFVAGSCFYVNDTDYDRPGTPYGGDYQILDQIIKSKPDFMVWLGDNIYLREGDFESRSGIYYRNTHTRSLPELQPLIASTPNYAIWDDHDYGPNDSDWTYPLKHHSLDAFKNFWPSDSYGSGHTEGITQSFIWNDCQFFMLDDRWYRTVDRENGTILGEQQKYWLKEALLYSKATFKFICVGGQFLNDAKVFENFANYESERSEIIQFLDDNNIKGVVFITGDRHHSEICKLKTPNGNKIYDVTSSAITSSTGPHTEPNTLRVPDSMIGVRNFAIFKISGQGNGRKLQVEFKDKAGNCLFNYNFSFSE
jgi:alkaline phosphatase D